VYSVGERPFGRQSPAVIASELPDSVPA
jgi:hypothetical protein